MKKAPVFSPIRCAECGEEFTPRSSHTKYCSNCTLKVVRRQTAERSRQWRARLKESKINSEVV